MSQPLSSKANYFFQQGQQLSKAKAYAAAIAQFDRALENQPDWYAGWYERGKALYDLGNYQAAIFNFKEVLVLKSDYAPAWNNRGMALAKLNRHNEAVASYDRAIELAPKTIKPGITGAMP